MKGDRLTEGLKDEHKIGKEEQNKVDRHIEKDRPRESERGRLKTDCFE